MKTEIQLQQHTCPNHGIKSVEIGQTLIYEEIRSSDRQHMRVTVKLIKPYVMNPPSVVLTDLVGFMVCNEI